MAEQVQQTTVNTFIRGLITEASPLTYPENASVDELNMVLERNGVRKRRKGIQYEDNNVLSSFTVAQGELTHTETWSNVANVSGIEFLVFQHGGTLHFYDKSSIPISSGEKSFSIDLNDFSAGNGEIVENNRIDATSIDGKLIVVSNAIEPFSIEYDPDADTISTEQIEPKVRDFEWQGDTSTYFKPGPRPFSEERKYDTINAGWTRFALFTATPGYVQFNDKLPPLSLPWWVATNPTDPSDNDRIFHEPFFRKMDKGTTLVGNGRIILDLFRKNRTAAANDLDTGLTVSLETEIDNTRFTTVTTFAGRVWFSGLSSKKNGSKIYFSRVVQSSEDIGKFYQIGDPTSQQDPDLVDSDGGVISISGAANIRALFTFGDKVLVFAENGVWEIGGVDSVFKATEFFVRRINGADGLFNRNTLVNAEGIPLWWGNNGIFTISQEEVSGLGAGRNISESTVQTFWDNIGQEQKSRAVGIFDENEKQVLWLYESEGATEFKYNNVLLLDLVLGAFFPWEFKDQTSNTNYVVGLSYFSGLGAVDTAFDVVAGADDVVAGADDVVSSMFQEKVDGPTEARFIARDGATGKVTFAEVSSSDFVDWGDVDYTSFAETIYYFDGDLTTRKNNIYVTTYFNLTETGFIGEDDDEETNNPPVAVDDNYDVDKNETLTITVPGVMENDDDPDGDPITAVLDTDVSNGSLTLNSDGSFTYTPDNDFVGEDTFTYHVNDGTDDSNIATVTITVTEPVSAANVLVTCVDIPTEEDTLQDITIPGFGTPSAAIFIYSMAESNGTLQPHSRGSIGATDGSKSWVVSHVSQDGNINRPNSGRSTSRNDGSGSHNPDVVVEINAAGEFREVRGHFEEWITDGVRLNWFHISQPAIPSSLTVVLIKGDLDVAVGWTDPPSTVTTGFEPKAMLFASARLPFPDDAEIMHNSIGMASWDGTTLRQANRHAFASGSLSFPQITETINFMRVDDDAVGSREGSTAGARVAVDNITTTSFDLIDLDDGFDPGDEIAYIAIGGVNAYVDVFDSPTSTGTHDFTGPSFQPTFAWFGTSMVESVGVKETGSVWGEGLVDILSECTYGWSIENGIDVSEETPSNTNQVADEKTINLYDHTGSTQTFLAVYDSFLSNGIRLDFSAADSTAHKWPVLMIG